MSEIVLMGGPRDGCSYDWSSAAKPKSMPTRLCGSDIHPELFGTYQLTAVKLNPNGKWQVFYRLREDEDYRRIERWSKEFLIRKRQGEAGKL